MKITVIELKNILSSELEKGALDHIDESTNLEHFGLDSVGFFTMIYKIEDACNIEFDEETLDQLTLKSTLGDLLSVITAKGVEVVPA
ncbi:acyl carrier protein [Catenovulum sediminis]|uniref:Acyl carrier protein n=1 Tax=Catenovulum sediminis TaxID=1740262 RepID=A0ABV1RCF6_9ALTE|nr:acyl carrier protein [Catenovulum sediminis]